MAQLRNVRHMTLICRECTNAARRIKAWKFFCTHTEFLSWLHGALEEYTKLAQRTCVEYVPFFQPATPRLPDAEVQV